MTLVLLRHGRSVWNDANLFTGWHDIGLSEQGVQEARQAGQLMRDAGLWFDKAHTSVLRRAVETANLALEEMGQVWLPVERSWRLNERHYGALQGLDKKQTAEQHGLEQVKLWRRSYDVPPPPVGLDSEHHPANDRRYHRLPPDVLPASECLADVVARVLPYWYDRIVPDLRAGLTLLVAAHGNSLRALVKHLEGISDADISELDIPTGVPAVYRFRDDFTIESKEMLGDAEEIAARAAEVKAQAGAR